MKKILSFFKRLWHRCHKPNFYVIADSRDNSITFSKELFDHLQVMEQEKAKVYVFQVRNDLRYVRGGYVKQYAFCINPPLDDTTTHLADIQYNAKHKCVGFECLIPTVNRIFYDYGLPSDSKAKLTLEECQTELRFPNSDHCTINYYKILPPYGERHQNHPQA